MRHRRLAWQFVIVAPALICLLTNDATRAEDSFLAETLVPFLNEYCSSCHGGDEPSASFSLDHVADAAAVRTDARRWGAVVEYLEAGIMPPGDQPQPSADEVAATNRWIMEQLAKLDNGAQRNPGRVTIRRLNRAEYDNTIRDLVGISYKPAADFPSDDVGYGFDNIGDVLSTPPILLEKYLAAAEKIAAEAIQSPWPPAARAKRFSRKQLTPATAQTQNSDQGIQGGETLVLDKDLIVEADYLVRCRAHVEPPQGTPVRIIVRAGDQDVLAAEVTARAGSHNDYEGRIRLPAGKQRISVTCNQNRPDAGDSESPAPESRLVIEWLEVDGPHGELGPPPAAHRRIIFREPAGDEEACAREILTRFAGRAYRRPVTAEEVARLMQLFQLAQEAGEGFESGIRLAVQAALVSPHFLYRVELDADTASGAPVQPVDDHQLACRLSYFLWSSMPDEELFRLAEQGNLSRDDVLAAQVDRMLADPRSQALVENFAGQWLQLRNLTIASPDRKRFKSFDNNLRSAMKRETELFFESVMREDRSILELLDADYTFLNERLAKHYGMADIAGDEFRRVTLGDRRRGGLLTQASILTITSNPTRTSPVKRGKWIMEQILGTPPPPPPPGVQELEQIKLAGTLRQKMEQHRASPTCAVCHARMDPLGFAFENFDAVGAWRDKDEDQDIDASGTLPDGQSFHGPAELRSILKNKPELFARSLVRKMLTYALGRGLEPFDSQTVYEVTGRLKARDYRFTALVQEVVRSEPFRMRRTIGAR